MKTRLKLSWLIVTVFALTGLLPTARAFYAPATQRWLNRDPIGEPGFETIRNQRPSSRRGGSNRYLVVLNNPINQTDPLGLDRNHNGPPSSDYIFPRPPAPPASNPCASIMQNEFKTCMQSFSQGLCLNEAYNNLHGAMQASEWAIASSQTGPVQKVVGYGLAWELRLSTVLFGTFYGGGAAGCAAKAIGEYNACVVENFP